MAETPEDTLRALEEESARRSKNALGEVRRASRAQRDADTGAWLSAGDSLAEKVIAALDTGDDERAERLVRRIVALPVVDETVRAGPMAVSVLLYNEIIDPSFEGGDARGLLDLPLRLLPDLDDAAADALRHTLAAITDYELPEAMLRRIRSVVPLERKSDPPFAGVPEQELPAAVLAVLRLVLRLRSEEAPDSMR